MLKAAFQEGARAASKRFGVREASLMDLLLTVGTPMAARAGLNVMAPHLVPSIEKKLEVPFRALKGVGNSAMRAMRGPRTPADVLTHGLAGAPAQGALRELPAILGQGSR